MTLLLSLIRPGVWHGGSASLRRTRGGAFTRPPPPVKEEIRPRWGYLTGVLAACPLVGLSASDPAGHLRRVHPVGMYWQLKGKVSVYLQGEENDGTQVGKA